MAMHADESVPGGDPAAFGEFYVANAKPMLVFFTRRVLDPETALELTAETFAQAFASWGRLRARRARRSDRQRRSKLVTQRTSRRTLLWQ